MIALKRILRRTANQRTVPNPAPTTTSTTQAPAPEENTQLDPPPYSASSTNQPDQNGTPQAATPQEIAVSQSLLDPALNFTAAQMEQQWRAKDKIFARAVVQFVAERFDGNLRGWAGYKYTYICEVSIPLYSY
jgi:hypothetical protein